MRAVCAALVGLVVVLPASGHHSGSVFNRNLVSAVQGTVSRFRWGNPHVYIYVVTKFSHHTRFGTRRRERDRRACISTVNRRLLSARSRRRIDTDESSSFL